MGEHSESKKKYKNRKKFIVIILIAIIIIAGITIKLKFTEKEPVDDETLITETVNSAFSALNRLNASKANKYLDYETLVNSLDEMIIEQRGNKVSSVEKKLFSNLEWNIESVSMTSDTTAMVTIEATNKDFNNVIINWINILLEMDRNSVTSEVQVEKLEEAIEQTTETKTITKKIKLVKNDGSWTIKVNTNLRDLVYTGIDSIASVLEGYE